jgi:hypothetical protein
MHSDYALQFTITHKHTTVHSHVFTSRCSVPASNCERFPSSGLPNYPRPQLQQLSSQSQSQSYFTTGGLPPISSS